MRVLNVAVIGCGQIAQSIHLPVLASLPAARVTALVELDPRLARRAADATGAQVWTDIDELLDSGSVEAVVICLPNALHAPVAIKAFESGHHVYLEKPIALDLESAREVVAAWHASQKVGMIGFNYRYSPLNERMAAALATGRAGDLVAVRSSFCAATPEIASWKQSAVSGGGALLDLASHHVDLLRFWTGSEVKKASAMLGSHRYEADSACLHLELENGVVYSGLFSFFGAQKDEWDFIGENGNWSIDRYGSPEVQWRAPNDLGVGAGLRRLARSPRVLRHRREMLERRAAPGNELSYASALQCFLSAALNGDQEATPSLHDGFAALEILHRATSEFARVPSAWLRTSPATSDLLLAPNRVTPMSS